MIKNIHIELNSEGIKELLKSDEIQAKCDEVAEIVKGNAESMSGQQYATRKVTDASYSRAATNVYCATDEAIKDNLENNTLLKAKHI